VVKNDVKYRFVIDMARLKAMSTKSKAYLVAANRFFGCRAFMVRDGGMSVKTFPFSKHCPHGWKS